MTCLAPTDGAGLARTAPAHVHRSSQWRGRFAFDLWLAAFAVLLIGGVVSAAEVAGTATDIEAAAPVPAESGASTQLSTATPAEPGSGAEAPPAVTAEPGLGTEIPPAVTAEPGMGVDAPSVALGPTADPGFDDTESEWEDDWDDWDDEFETTPEGYPDPFEPVNRVSLSFNNAMDKLVLDPVTRLYRFSLPEFARQTVVRVFNNLNSPQVMVNDGLQLEWRDAGVIMSRVLINSTAGLGGIFDAAAPIGLEHHESGFGQTLALAGVPPGTYLILPLLGPANMRDGVGFGVDALLHPTFYLLGGTDLLIFGGSTGLTARARHFEELQALKDSSVDVYSAMRNGYYQNRQAEIWGRREDRRPQAAGASEGDAL